MGANERAVKAINAMKNMGISEKRVKPVLKNLLRLYDKNWQLIEDDHYSVLIDAIFEDKEEEATQKNGEEQLHEDPTEPLMKKMCLRGTADAPVSAIESDILPIAQTSEHDPLSSQVKYKDKSDQEALALPSPLSRPEKEEQSQLCLRDRSARHPISPQSLSRDKGKDPMLPPLVYRREGMLQSRTQTGQNVASHDPPSPQAQLKRKEMEHSSSQMTLNEKGGLQARPSFFDRLKEQQIESGIILSPKKKVPDNGLIRPKSEPLDDYSHFEIPLAIMPPINSEGAIDIAVEDGRSTLNGSAVQVNGVKSLVCKDNHNVNFDKACEAVTNSDLPTVPEMPMSYEIASSPKGEVKISLGCSQSFERPGLHVPSVDEVLKAVEDRCLRSYRILDPNFSILKLFQETCQSFLDLSNKPANPNEDCLLHHSLDLNFKKKSNLHNAFGDIGSQQDRIQLPTSISDGSSNGKPSALGVSMLRMSNIEGDDLLIDQGVEHDPLLSQVNHRDVQDALDLPSACYRADEEEQSQLCPRDRSKHHPISPQTRYRDKWKDPMLPSSVCCREEILQSSADTRQHVANLNPKPGDYSLTEVPIAMMPPTIPKEITDIVNGVDSLASKGNQIVIPDRACEAVASMELATVPETPVSFEIASSPLGEVKISLSCSQSFEWPDAYVPSLDEVLKAVEDKCLRSYRILDPNFSIMNLFQDMCQSFLDLGSQKDRVQLPTSVLDGSSNGHQSAEAVLTLSSNIEGDDLEIAQRVEHDLSQVKDMNVEEVLALPSAPFRSDEEEESQLCLRDRYKHHRIAVQSRSRDQDPFVEQHYSTLNGSIVQVNDGVESLASKDNQLVNPDKECEEGYSTLNRFTVQMNGTESLASERCQIDNLDREYEEAYSTLNGLTVQVNGTESLASEGNQICNPDRECEDGDSTLDGRTEQVNGIDSLVSKDNQIVVPNGECKAVTSSELATVPEMPMSFEIASSPLGDVKISLCCSYSFERPGVRLPSLDEVFRAVEDKCLRSYRILDPDFSIMKLFQETCQSFSDLSSQQGQIQLLTNSPDGSLNGQPSAGFVLPEPPNMLLHGGLENHRNPQSAGNCNGGEDALNGM